MTSRGTLDREDDLPPGMVGGTRLRQNLALRPELRVDEAEEDVTSQASELMNESVVSSVTDRYGCILFFINDQPFIAEFAGTDS